MGVKFTPGGQGSCVMILKIFPSKKVGEKMSFITQNMYCVFTYAIHNMINDKRQFFSPKMAKNAENNDHNIDPRSFGIAFVGAFLDFLSAILFMIEARCRFDESFWVEIYKQKL
jgi:hypothetical protein